MTHRSIIPKAPSMDLFSVQPRLLITTFSQSLLFQRSLFLTLTYKIQSSSSACLLPNPLSASRIFLSFFPSFSPPQIPYRLITPAPISQDPSLLSSLASPYSQPKSRSLPQIIPRTRKMRTSTTTTEGKTIKWGDDDQDEK